MQSRRGCDYIFKMLSEKTTNQEYLAKLYFKSDREIKAFPDTQKLSSSSPSLQMVIAAMKLKDAYSLEGTL